MNSGITSPTAQVIIAIIPIVGICIGGMVIFFSLLWHHHEVKLQIKMGTYHKETVNLKACSLLIGIMLIGIGTILSLFFLAMEGISPAMLGGLIPLSVGICLIVFYKTNPDFKQKDGK